MKKDFPETSSEVSKWLKWYFGRTIPEPIMHGQIQSGQRNDIWNAYLYNDTVKFVYIKAGIPAQMDGEKKQKTKCVLMNEGERFSQSLSRSRARVYELAMCNEFQYFGTFTQNKEMRDRFDLREFRKDFAQYVRNLNRAREEDEKIKYLMIPEQHKNGAWHMHGLLQGLREEDLRAFRVSEKIPERIKRTIRNGTPVYDWTGYRTRFGFFTATKVGNKTAVSKYITKYLTKDMSAATRSAGEHLFFASQGLKGRERLIHDSREKCPISKWDWENKYVKIAEVKIDKLSAETLGVIFGG